MGDRWKFVFVDEMISDETGFGELVLVMLIKGMQVEIKRFALSWQLRQIFSTYLHVEGK